MAGVSSIEHVYQVADSTLALMAANGVALVPTDIDSLSIIRYVTLQSGSPPPAAMVTSYLAGGRARLMRAIKAGVAVAAGSDNYLDLDMPQGQAAKHNLHSYRESGMAAADVLRAATWNNAGLLGLEGRIGVLKAGAFADLIAIEGDPVGGGFDAIDRVTFVMRNGTVYVRP
jgi:imidazolonepropionase-like amidohydrolase